MRQIFITALFIGGFLFNPAQAQDRNTPPTVLVIDASNSMWGRIDGKAKMEIARDAVGSVVDTLPKGTRLGIVAYGHRRAGDCSDIEAILPLGPVDKSKVQAVANRLTPRGKTPITAALKEAAGLLDAGKPGNVIIVTDGIETCKADPCALAEELKRANAGFVAHVIGFDVSSVERPKLSCIAERTGGTFVAASNAGELGQALKASVQAKAKPAVVTRKIALEATDGGRPVSNAAFTVARNGETGVIAEGVSDAVALSPGRYRVSALTAAKTGQVEVEVTKDAPAKIVVALAGDLPKANLQPAKTSTPATGRLDVRWSGPDGKGDYVVFARANGEALETRHYSYTSEGNPLKVRVPGEPGEYELRYVSDATGAILARTKITATPVTATLDAPAKGAAGSEIAVTFNGPNADEDWIGLAKPGSDVNSYEAFAWVMSGAPAKLLLPAEPGAYEIRYISGLDPKTLATRKIDVTQASASLTAPARATAGSTIEIGFKGSGGGDTFIGVVKKGAAPGAWAAFEYPKGEQVALRLPGEPGAYEVRFVLEANGVYKVLASSPLTIDPAVASVTAPDRVKRGAPVAITFTGPKGEGDFVTIVPPASAPETFADYQDATPDKASITLEAPAEAGVYEVRYVMAAPGEGGHQIIARKTIRVD
ncbi:vWA domain-containing protein [Microvirga terricola]|uniref:VWA domain-containing protein n=1 Tax=Microvirga terricola TaxID=2719797 RepID=A0ABX0VCZ7_9HYPH|nr:VWA domain-containing protein [Microvirga terricola]NIX76545.1 VWA domain-containing protein [Microvirga terricola]